MLVFRSVQETWLSRMSGALNFCSSFFSLRLWARACSCTALCIPCFTVHRALQNKFYWNIDLNRIRNQNCIFADHRICIFLRIFLPVPAIVVLYITELLIWRNWVYVWYEKYHYRAGFKCEMGKTSFSVLNLLISIFSL